MKLFRLHHHHRKIVHISLGIVVTFLAILGVFFSSYGASAAVTPIAKKTVTNLTAAEIAAEKAAIEEKKSGLEAQIMTEKNKITENRTRQIELYTQIDTYKEIVSEWKKIDRNYRKYTQTVSDLEKITVKIAQNNKETDKQKKIELEKTKISVSDMLKGNLEYIKERDTSLGYTLETLSKTIIKNEKNKVEKALLKAKEDLKIAKTDKRTILKEQRSIKKVITDAGSYLSRLVKQGFKLLEQGNNTNTGTCTDGVQNGNETGVDTGGRCVTNDVTTGTGTCTDGVRNGNETGVDTGGRCVTNDVTTGTGTCTDGVRNGNETGVDTGGRCVTNDVTTGTGTCTDGVRNGNETGVDTGGRCVTNDVTTGTGTCTDGVRNGNETGVDTGGRCGISNVPGYTPPSNGYLLIPTARATATAVANGDGTKADIKSGGSGYIYPPLVIVSGTGTCTQFPTAISSIENGMVKNITLTGGVCSKAPTLSISAPQVTATAIVNENAARTAKVTNFGSGYLGAPEVKVTAATTVCTTPPTATATVAHGKVTAVTLSQNAFCTGKPTLTIDPPMIPATATVTKIDDSHFTVNLTENGAGYATKPLVKVTSTICAVIPRAVVTMNADKIGTIVLEGGLCATAPVITIEKPDRIGVPIDVPTETMTGNNYFVNRVAATATFARNTTTGDITATITKKGSGYLFPPKITGTLSNTLACPEGLTGTTKIKNGVLEDITFTGQCSTLPTFVLPPPTSKAVANLQFNGETLTVTMTNAGTGYSTAQPPTVTVTNCPNVTAQATVSQTGTITGIQFSGAGACTGTPAFTISAPTTGIRATATFAGAGLMANITNSGSGYVAPPKMTISAATCTGTAPSATATLTEGRVTGVTVLGNCRTIPTVTFEDPIISATATTTKTGDDTFQVNYTNRGAGYVVPPRIAVTGSCKLLPYAKSTLEEGRIKEITFIGARGCTGPLSLTIDPPGQIEITPDEVKTLSPDSARIFQPAFVSSGTSVNVSNLTSPSLGAGTINFTGGNTITSGGQ